MLTPNTLPLRQEHLAPGRHGKDRYLSTRWRAMRRLRNPAIGCAAFAAMITDGRGAWAVWETATTALAGTSALAIIGLVLVAFCVARIRRAHAELGAARRTSDVARSRLEQDLKHAGMALVRWSRESDEEVESLGLVGSYSRLAEIFSDEDFERLSDAAEALRTNGTPFRLALRSGDGLRSFDAEGSRAHEGGFTLWLHDTTESTQRETELATQAATLREDAERLRSVLDVIEIPIWRRSSEFDLKWCNATYAARVEATRDEAVADGGIELVSNVPRAEARALSQKALEGGATERRRRHVVVDGERRLFEIFEAPAPDEIGTIGWAQDVTEVEIAEADLRRHIAAHAEVLESLNTAIAIYSAKQRLAFFNSEFVKLYGLDEHWLASEPTLGEVVEAQREQKRLPEEADWRAFKRRMNELFTSLTEPQEELLHLPDETTLRCIISPHPFGGLQFMTQDVTDRMALERSYSTLTAVQRATLDNLYEAVAVFGADGRLKLSNPGYAELWSLDPSDVEGEPHMTDLVDRSKELVDYGDDWDAYRVNQIAHITERQRSHHRLYQRDGKVLDCSFVPLPDGATLLTYLDVTDSVQVEQALRERAEALETADRLKSEFLANVSYELRTPLNTVIGFTEILANQYFGPLNERQQEYARGSLESSQHLLSLINNILDLATIEAGLMVLDIGTVDVRDMLKSMLNLTHERIQNKNLDVSFRCDQEVGRLDGDERRLKQVVFNLLSNAIKFTPSGGNIELGARREGDVIALWVSDTGIGIDREEFDRVFDKFSRASNTPARQSGTGLGLSLVKNFVELHGGRVEMDSTPERGTTVTCRFPIGAMPRAVVNA